MLPLVASARRTPGAAAAVLFFGSPAELMTQGRPSHAVRFGLIPLPCLADPCPQQLEPGSPVHLPLDYFQSVHLALDGAVAPRLYQCRRHGRLVLTQAVSERPHLDAARTCRLCQ